MTTQPPASAAASALAPATFDWSQRVGPVDYYVVPRHASGQWTPRAPLGDAAVLLSLIPATPPSTDAERLSFVSELARLDVRTGAVTTLVRLQPGTQVYGPVVAGHSIAWVETSAVDLRAYGWRIHITDMVTGSDRVVAADSGARAEGVDSVIPAIAYDGTTLIFTALARGQSGFVWEIRRLMGEKEVTLAEVPDARSQRVTTISADERSVAWIESVSQPEPHAKIGVYDRSRDASSRRRTSMSSAYKIALAGDRIFVATGLGVVETDRTASYEPKRVGSDTAPVDQIAVVGQYLLYRNFNAEQTLVAIDLSSGARSVVAVAAVSGPVEGNRNVIWFQAATTGSAGKIGRTRV